MPYPLFPAAQDLHGLLAQFDPATAERFAVSLDQWAAAQPEMITTQIDVLNRYWRTQLIMLPFDTSAERTCLCNSNHLPTWLDNFRTYVLPTVLANHLPRLPHSV